MRRFATTILALGAGLSLSACHTVGRLSEANTITGKPVQTEMIVANHTGKAITVTFDRCAVVRPFTKKYAEKQAITSTSAKKM